MLNPGFLPFKDRHKGQSVTIVATGPTLEHYIPASDCVFLAINRAIVWRKDIPFDYWFFGDPWPMNDMIPWPVEGDAPSFEGEWKERDSYNIPLEMNWAKCGFAEMEHRASVELFKAINPKIAKFGHTYHMGLAIEKSGAIPYELKFGNDVFKKDITKHYLVHGSQVFSAVQFVLYAGFEEVKLVGCDCTQIYEAIIPTWQKFRDFARKHYPHVRFISVNPINLTDIGFECEYRQYKL